MGRENCNMCSCLGDTIYCDYYDVFYMKCSDMENCPEGLDDEDLDEEDFYHNDDWALDQDFGSN